MLRVLGAGLPRTGTTSLKVALEQLLGGRCYNMAEVFGHLDHVPIWRRAVQGRPPDWSEFLAPYVAAVDWPVAAFWRELSEAEFGAIVVLSLRDTPQTWWQSADATILNVARRERLPEYGDWLRLFQELLATRFTERWDDPPAAMAAYERHNDDVRRTIPPDRLLEWRPEDGWAPICRALHVPIPDDAFTQVNTRDEWTSPG
jgi:hypothetical protein